MSSKEDLRNFQLQLDQVNDGLSLAPDDQELLDLKAELTDLIALLKDQLKTEVAEQEAKQRKWQQKKPFIQQPKPQEIASPTPGSNTEDTQSPEPRETTNSTNKEYVIFKVGDIVSAKWSKDGGYYPAKIT